MIVNIAHATLKTTGLHDLMFSSGISTQKQSCELSIECECCIK